MPPLQLVAVVDSDDLAAAHHQALHIRRHTAALLGLSAVKATQEGRYQTEQGVDVSINQAVESAIRARVSIPPDAQLPDPPAPRFGATRVEVANETTFGAVHRLIGQGLRPLALNFANGIHPGGGFLHGARAQEEVLCRSSALYLTLLNDPMYEAHLRRPRPDSTDWAILSPQVPVFRHDDGTNLDEPWLLDFITCAAPVATHIGQPDSGDLLETRIHRVLAIAHSHGYTALVLGAWGCGAFGNDPVRTALDFRAALEGPFDGAFSDVVLAITDWSPERKTLGPFRDVFSPDAAG